MNVSVDNGRISFDYCDGTNKYKIEDLAVYGGKGNGCLNAIARAYGQFLAWIDWGVVGIRDKNNRTFYASKQDLADQLLRHKRYDKEMLTYDSPLASQSPTPAVKQAALQRFLANNVPEKQEALLAKYKETTRKLMEEQEKRREVSDLDANAEVNTVLSKIDETKPVETPKAVNHLNQLNELLSKAGIKKELEELAKEMIAEGRKASLSEESRLEESMIRRLDALEIKARERLNFTEAAELFQSVLPILLRGNELLQDPYREVIRNAFGVTTRGGDGICLGDFQKLDRDNPLRVYHFGQQLDLLFRDMNAAAHRKE